MSERRTLGEQWSNTYRNPPFDYDRDQENTAMLVDDVRRATRLGIIGVVILAIALVLSGGVEPGLSLLLLVGGPLLIIRVVGELLRRWSQRHDGKRAKAGTSTVSGRGSIHQPRS